jgi:alanine racemase
VARPARALLSAEALRHNFQEVRRRAPRSRVLAIIKSNGYGHGMVWAAQTLTDADGFGVEGVEQGVTLREAGITKPITLLEGFFEPAELALISKHRLWCAIHNDEQLRALESARLDQPVSVWIKLDTGMHRLGFEPDQFRSVLARLKSASSVGEIRAMTHFACSDDPKSPATVAQMQRFDVQLKSTGIETSLANSAGIISWPASHQAWVRPGIMLYGGAPMIGTPAAAVNLKSVMTLQSALISVKHCKRGDPVGYGEDFVCPEDMVIGVAAMGYGDGYPRRTPVGTPVLVNGRRAVIAGRVSMDMLTIDLRSQPEAKVGDPVVFWGDGMPADDIAARVNTISYELFCQLTARVPRVVDHG